MGLNVKWGDRNLGAETPTDVGNYYAWGEIEPKESYSKSTCKICNDASITSIVGNAKYDAATAKLGDKWRMPTKEEIEALIESCTWTLETVSGKEVYKVTEPSKAFIYLPKTDFIVNEYTQKENIGYYWSANFYDNQGGTASVLYLSSSAHGLDYYFLYAGLAIRPVYGDVPAKIEAVDLGLSV